MRTTTMVSAWTSNPSLMVCGLVFATCSPRTLELLVFGLSIVLAGVARLRSPANYSCHLQDASRPSTTLRSNWPLDFYHSLDLGHLTFDISPSSHFAHSRHEKIQ